MRRTLAALLLGTLVAAAALPALAAGHKVFGLTTQNKSGEWGTITLIPLGEKTRVELAVVGTPEAVSQPAHIHDGTCAKLNPKPKYGLAPIVDGRSVTVVGVSMAALEAAPFAVNVHESAAKIGNYVACGDLKAAPPAK